MFYFCLQDISKDFSIPFLVNAQEGHKMHSTKKNSKIHSSTELSKSWQLLSITFSSLLVSLSTCSSSQISPRIFLDFAHLGVSV